MTACLSEQPAVYIEHIQLEGNVKDILRTVNALISDC